RNWWPPAARPCKARANDPVGLAVAVCVACGFRRRTHAGAADRGARASTCPHAGAARSAAAGADRVVAAARAAGWRRRLRCGRYGRALVVARFERVLGGMFGARRKLVARLRLA